MTTATREKPNLWAYVAGAEQMGWPVKTHPAHSTGLESKKTSSDGENFSLDFSFYRTGENRLEWRRSMMSAIAI